MPEWSDPKISFVLVHRSFDFQIGTSLKERGNRPQPGGLTDRLAAGPYAARQMQRWCALLNRLPVRGPEAAASSASTAAAFQALEASKKAVFDGFLILRASRHRHHAHHALCRFSSPRLPFGRKRSFYGSVGGDTGQETARHDRDCTR
jgi:hypothetical protein